MATPAAPTLAERILAHLAAFPVPEDAPDVPREITQEGIADALGVRVAHVSRALKSLLGQELVKAHLAHPQGGVRRARAHTLTPRGFEVARALPAGLVPRRTANAAATRPAVRPPAGRSSEFNALVDAFESARTQGPRFVLLEGDAGSGKSRLLQTFRAEAERRGARVLAGQSSPTGAEQLVGPIGPALAPLGFERRFRARNAGTPRERALGAAVETLTSAARGEPVVLLLDDLQYAGASVADFLHGLLVALPRGARVLFVGAMRREEAWALPNGPLYSALMPLRSESDALHLDLKPLDRGGVATLLDDAGIHVLGDRKLAEELIDRVWRESGGNTMFALAMGLELADGVNEEDFFPASVRAAAKQHFAGLPPEVLHVLQTTAVAGPEVDYETLRRAHDGEEEQLVRTLDTLIDRLLVEEVVLPEGSKDLRLRFRHPKVREAVLADLSATRRRWLESRVAAAHQA